MRKFFLGLVLLASAAFWSGCSSSDNANSVAPKANETGTTTYNAPDMSSNTAATSSAPTTAAPSGGGASNMANSNKGATKGTPPHIKPPT